VGLGVGCVLGSFSIGWSFLIGFVAIAVEKGTSKNFTLFWFLNFPRSPGTESKNKSGLVVFPQSTVRPERIQAAGALGSAAFSGP